MFTSPLSSRTTTGVDQALCKLWRTVLSCLLQKVCNTQKEWNTLWRRLEQHVKQATCLATRILPNVTTGETCDLKSPSSRSRPRKKLASAATCYNISHIEATKFFYKHQFRSTPSVGSPSFKLLFKLVTIYLSLTSPASIILSFYINTLASFSSNNSSMLPAREPTVYPSSLCSANPVLWPHFTGESLLEWLSHTEVFFGHLTWQQPCCLAAWIFL